MVLYLYIINLRTMAMNLTINPIVKTKLKVNKQSQTASQSETNDAGCYPALAEDFTT
jgi:hypothetical protein